mmetsp:Transcript_22351/g.68808  ORF Transcript_22351/g.68808 Transcript_22351/m.68808 type:complete len:604 (+) Transcript_22351:100-1911(+)
MEGSTLTFLPPNWADQLTVMKIYEDVDKDEFFFNNYIWFKAMGPDEEDAADEPAEKEEMDEAVLYRLRQQAAMFGAAKHLKLLSLGVEIARAASERRVARAERERDEALDAVEFVTKAMLAVRGQLEKTSKERDDARSACATALADHGKLEEALERLADRQAKEEDATKRRVAALEAERDDARRDAHVTEKALALSSSEISKERDEARRALTLLEKTSTTERAKAAKEHDALLRRIDAKAEALVRLDETCEEAKTALAAVGAENARLKRDVDDALKARERLEAVLAGVRRDLDEVRNHRDQLSAELEYASAFEDADGVDVRRTELAVAAVVVDEDRSSSVSSGRHNNKSDDKVAATLAAERDDARADAENSRRVVERVTSELVAARKSEGGDAARLAEENAQIRRERDVLHAKLCSLVYDTHPAKATIAKASPRALEAAEFFKREPGALAMLASHAHDDLDDLDDVPDELDDATRARSDSLNWPPTSEATPRTKGRLRHPRVKEESSPPRADDDSASIASSSAAGWTTTSRVGWPPSRHKSTALQRVADDDQAGHTQQDDLPVWVKRIAPHYSKADFDNVRLRCLQFQAEVARAHRATVGLHP